MSEKAIGTLREYIERITWKGFYVLRSWVLIGGQPIC